MTFPSDTVNKESLINVERMNRQVICLNPDHATITIHTNEIQPRCPMCESLMVTVVKSVLTGEPYNTPRGKNELAG